MPDHRLLSSAAGQLGVQEDVVREFHANGWVKLIERHGALVISAKEQYKAKYVLHLRNERKLSDTEISLVLEHQTPPYSSKDVDRILAERTAKA